MPNPWFRLYSEFSDDPKVQILSEAMQRRLVMLMCSRCKDETLRETEIAFHWRISPAELAETKVAFLEQGFIDDQWNLVNWNRRQFLSDSSTERVRRYRKGLKQDETLHVTERNVTVTAPDTDTDTEADTKAEKNTSRSKVARVKVVDPRHSPFRTEFENYQRSSTGLEAHWDGRQARALGVYLAGSPKMTEDHWKQILRNRSISEVSHGEPLAAWIANAKMFYNHPLDRFGKPLGGNNGNGNFKGSTRVTLDAAQRAIELIDEKEADRRNAGHAEHPAPVASGSGRLLSSGQ